MKIPVVIFFLATAAVAQTPTAACGPGDVQFKVTLDDKPHAPTLPARAKALAYFIHDAGSTGLSFAYPTTKLAIDGAWVGAGHGDSWFAVSVDPGEHHLCATLQSSIVEDRVELAHFTAEAGKVYYFRTRLVMSQQVELLELERIDDDQGNYLVKTFPMSTWKTHK
jgi:hypothetical protein